MTQGIIEMERSIFPLIFLIEKNNHRNEILINGCRHLRQVHSRKAFRSRTTPIPCNQSFL